MTTFEKQRKAVIAEMRAIVANTDARGEQIMSREDAAKFEKLEAEIERLDSQIGRRDSSAVELLAKVHTPIPVPMPDIIPGGSTQANVGSETWVDREGREVSVLAKGQSLAAAIRKRGSDRSPYDLGHVVKHLAGVQIPRDVRMAMSEGTNSAGGYLVNPELSAQVIDLIRAKSRVVEAGARTVEMPTQTLYMARLTQDPACVWHAENTADLLAAGAQFDRVVFQSHTLGSVIVLSKELIADASNCSEIVTQALAKAFSLEVDRAALLGDGTAGSPVGLAHISGVASTAGSAMTDYSQFVNSVGRMMANSTFPNAFITSPQVRIKAEGLTDTLHQPLRKNDILATVPILDTAKVPYASGSNVYAGDWTGMLIGVRAEFELTALRERYAELGQVGLAAWLRCDIQIAHNSQFDIITGVS